ncbi:MAG: hypothetical protein C5B47_05760 [Verrucomicrobia bacterium]|nr:MAG: hypothetical protein C5B47_05760 [Verrucomicrobiota bacterium]
MPIMNCFAQALNSALENVESNPVRLSQESGLNAVQVSQYCRGLALPELELLNQILRQFEINHRLELVAAYFRDLLPSELAPGVVIKSTSHVELRIAPELASSLPEEILTALKGEPLIAESDVPYSD